MTDTLVIRTDRDGLATLTLNRPDKLNALTPGVFVQLEDTVKSFKAVVDGEYDHLPEQAFYMVGGIDQAVEKAKKMAEEA